MPSNMCKAAELQLLWVGLQALNLTEIDRLGQKRSIVLTGHPGRACSLTRCRRLLWDVLHISVDHVLAASPEFSTFLLLPNFSQCYSADLGYASLSPPLRGWLWGWAPALGLHRLRQASYSSFLSLASTGSWGKSPAAPVRRPDGKFRHWQQRNNPGTNKDVRSW